MARRIMAGTVLALIALAVGLTVDFGDDADATVSYVGHRSLGNFAEIFSDTTGATRPDSISFDCEHIYKWSIAATSSANDIAYRFKIAGCDSVTGWGYLESVAATPQKWEIAPVWIDVKSASGSARYTICVQGYDAGDAGTVGVIGDAQVVY